MDEITVYPNNSVSINGVSVPNPEKIMKKYNVPEVREKDETKYGKGYKLVTFYNVRQCWKGGSKERNKKYAIRCR